MNNVLRWEEEEVIREKRVKESEGAPKGLGAKVEGSSRERNRGRKEEGKDMQSLLTWE